MKLQVEYMPIGELTPYDGNAKLHPQEQIEQIKRSIKEFGFNDPIAVSGEKCIVVEGHGRLIAAKEIGIENVPVIHLDGLTDEQRRAYALAHNKLTLNSDFDIERLQEELEKLEDVDMEAFGFRDMLKGRASKMAPVEELDIGSFSNEAFKHECPSCGFRF